ncbi:MAG TPA: ABC transporter permease subunit [Microlunatus sp.]
MNYSAYTAEVYRAGIDGVPKGQWEAATALSLPPVPTWGRVVLPQSIKVVLPVLGNYLIQMFKDSAILSAITVAEMITRANEHLDHPMEAFTLVGILFFVVSYPCSLLLRALERRRAVSA